MKNIFPITIPRTGVTSKITMEQAEQIFTKDELEKLEARFDVETVGPWQIVRHVRGICIGGTTWQTNEPCIVYGRRSLNHFQQMGYEAEGQVSIKGKNVRAFTSSHMFELPDGKLISAAVLHIGG